MEEVLRYELVFNNFSRKLVSIYFMIPFMWCGIGIWKNSSSTAKDY